MRKPEQKMWDRIRPVFNTLAKDYARIETGSTKHGVPDLYVLMTGWAMWVELKVGERVDDMLCVEVRGAQAFWAGIHEEMYGPECHLLIYEPTEKVYYHTKQAFVMSRLVKGPEHVGSFSRANDIRTISALWRRP
jgi:hypothetical protein